MMVVRNLNNRTEWNFDMHDWTTQELQLTKTDQVHTMEKQDLTCGLMALHIGIMCDNIHDKTKFANTVEPLLMHGLSIHYK